jgi:SAM-dependent methyltransferase
MRWRAKAHLLAIASRVPGGRSLYRLYQDRHASSMADAEEMFGRALDLIDLCRQGGADLRGCECLEVGTGWNPWVPLLLIVAGARRVVTTDINPWLSLKSAVGTTDALLARADRTAHALGVPERTIVSRLERARHAATLPQWLDALNITYHCQDLLSASLPAQSFDAVFSSNVLEHVEPATLRSIHLETWRVLRKGGRIVHRFNPQDHFSTVDRSITGANFLRFSEEEWSWLGGSGLSYHNRLRCPQHRALIVECGFEVVIERRRADARARSAIELGQLRVHPDFSSFNAADLTDDYMWVVAEKRRSAYPAAVSRDFRRAEAQVHG